MITSYSSFNNSPFSLKENVMAKLGIKEFSNLFDNTLFESDSDGLLLEKAYSTYELGLLYENRKDWFEDNEQIYSIEGEDGQILLFKNESLFFVSESTLRMLKEEWSWSNVSAAWNRVKSSATAAINTAKTAATKTWEVISDGAKKVWEFAKRITSAVVEFVKSDPLTCAAIFLQLLSAIVSFIPAAGQAVGPFCLALAGAIEVYVGTTKIRKAWKKFSNIEISTGTGGKPGALPAKASSSFMEGMPYLVAGSVSILLGLNDVLTAPKAAIPGAGATSTALRATSAKWSSSFAGQLAHTGEHFISNVAGKGAAKLGPSLSGPIAQFMGSGGSGLAATAVSVVMIKVGKSILGTFFDAVLNGMASIASAFSYILSLPTKASEMMEKLIAAAQSPISKILIAPLKNIINPVVKFLGKLLDTYIRPMVDGFSGYLKAVVKNRKSLESYADQTKAENKQTLASSEVRKVKPKNVEVSKEDLAKIKAIKKEVKKNESLNHIQGFEDFQLI
jgi:phage-related protein